VNLIPPRILEAARRKEQAVYWGLSLLTLGLIVLSIVPSMAQRNEMVLEQVEFEKTSISRYDPRIINPNTSPQTWTSLHEKELTKVKAEIASYQDVVSKLDGAYSSFKPWIDYMIVVNDMRPRGKVVLLWSIESTWLEGSATTGQTTSTSSRRSRRRSRSDDDEEEDEGSFGSGLGGAQMRTAGISQSPIKWASSGFLGIASGPLSNQIGGTGIGQTGGTSIRSDAQRESALPRPGRYNGLTIQGYADSVETIQAYVENLKKSGEFLDGAGVFWDDRFTDPVPPTVLDNAGGGAATQSNRGSMRRRRDDDDEDSGGSFNINANPMSSPGRPGSPGTDATLWLNPSALYPFRIELQFMGEPADQQTPATAQTSTGSLSPRGVSLRLNREDD
jgi:hypothetical protein